MSRDPLERAAVRLLGAGILAALLAGCAPPPESAAWLGINTQLGLPDQDGRWTSAKTTDRDREIYFDLVAELGVPRVRDLFMCWGRSQPQPDARLDFSVSDDMVRKAHAAHAEVLAVCWGVPRWASSAGGTGSIDYGVPAREHAEEFKTFVRKFVDRYNTNGLEDAAGLKQPIRAYEFMNEMEETPTAEYAFWLRLFYETVKSTDPRATVLVGGLRSPGLKTIAHSEGDYDTYFERLLAEPVLAGPRYPYFDAVSFHNYPASYPGRSEFDDAVAYLKTRMAARNLSLPLWLTEYGYNSGTREEEQQKDNIAKWALRAHALGIDRVYLYCLWDYRWPGETGPGENLGLVREVESGVVPPRKPAFRAFQILLQELQQRPRVTKRADGAYVLTGTGVPTYVIWKEESYEPAGNLMPGWWEIRTLSGKRMVRQGSTVPLTTSPVFVRRQRSPFIE